jgi:hypothetical protein
MYCGPPNWAPSRPVGPPKTPAPRPPGRGARAARPCRCGPRARAPSPPRRPHHTAAPPTPVIQQSRVSVSPCPGRGRPMGAGGWDGGWAPGGAVPPSVPDGVRKTGRAAKADVGGRFLPRRLGAAGASTLTLFSAAAAWPPARQPVHRSQGAGCGRAEACARAESAAAPVSARRRGRARRRPRARRLPAWGARETQSHPEPTPHHTTPHHTTPHHTTPHHTTPHHTTPHHTTPHHTTPTPRPHSTAHTPPQPNRGRPGHPARAPDCRTARPPRPCGAALPPRCSLLAAAPRAEVAAAPARRRNLPRGVLRNQPPRATPGAREGASGARVRAPSPCVRASACAGALQNPPPLHGPPVRRACPYARAADGPARGRTVGAAARQGCAAAGPSPQRRWVGRGCRRRPPCTWLLGCALHRHRLGPLHRRRVRAPARPGHTLPRPAGADALGRHSLKWWVNTRALGAHPGLSRGAGRCAERRGASPRTGLAEAAQCLALLGLPPPPPPPPCCFPPP